MFSKRVENIMKKGEIARYEQFLLFPPPFPTVFSKELYYKHEDMLQDMHATCMHTHTPK